MQLLALVPLVVLLVSAGALAASGEKSTTTIRKCQDAQGRWHFGDFAAEECEHSKVIEMSTQGVKKKEIAAPLTAEQLKQQEEQHAESERERLRAEERKRRDEVLLSSYGTESDIAYVRDRKLAQIEAAIQASEGTLTPLRTVLARMEKQLEEETKRGDQKAIKQTTQSIKQTQEQIARHEATIAAKKAEQIAVRKQYEEELARYRELKKSSAAPRK
jgi:hypothetical protein